LGSKTGNENVLLLPGLNSVNDDDWEVCKQHLTLQHDKQFIKEVKATVEIKNKETGKKEKKETSIFTEFDPQTAMKSVDDCFNIKTLEDWKKSEERSDIRNHIEEKIKEIKEKNTGNKKIINQSRDK
jgi:hypothetical protein